MSTTPSAGADFAQTEWTPATSRSGVRLLISHREFIPWLETGFLTGRATVVSESLSARAALMSVDMGPRRIPVLVELHRDTRIVDGAQPPLAALCTVTVVDPPARNRIAELVGASVRGWDAVFSICVCGEADTQSDPGTSLPIVELGSSTRPQRLLSGWLSAIAAAPPVPSLLQAIQTVVPAEVAAAHPLACSLRTGDRVGAQAKALKVLVEGVLQSDAERTLPESVVCDVMDALGEAATWQPRSPIDLGSSAIESAAFDEPRGVAAVLSLVREHLSPRDLIHAMRSREHSRITPDEHFAAWFVAGCASRARLPDAIAPSLNAVAELSGFVAALDGGLPADVSVRFRVAPRAGQESVLRLSGNRGIWLERPVKGIRAWTLADYTVADVREAAARLAEQIGWLDAIHVFGSARDVPIRYIDGGWRAVDEPDWDVSSRELRLDAWLDALQTGRVSSGHLYPAPTAWSERWVERRASIQNPPGTTNNDRDRDDTSPGDSASCEPAEVEIALPRVGTSDTSGAPRSRNEPVTEGSALRDSVGSVEPSQMGLRLGEDSQDGSWSVGSSRLVAAARAKPPVNWLKQPKSCGTSSIAGLSYVPRLLDPLEAADLLRVVDRGDWFHVTEGGRRVQHYGHAYDYSGRGVVPGVTVPAIPEWATRLSEQICARVGTKTPFEQLIVNEYQPGQGIAKHVDSQAFGGTVAIVSLGAAAMMLFAPRSGRARRERAIGAILEPGSLTVLSGAARADWTHEIPKRKSDPLPSEGDAPFRAVERGRRVSLTFRTLARREGG